MLEARVQFFYGLNDVSIKDICDVCFDLADIFRQDPDVFLLKPLEDLPFYVENANRLQKRKNRSES